MGRCWRREQVRTGRQECAGPTRARQARPPSKPTETPNPKTTEGPKRGLGGGAVLSPVVVGAGGINRTVVRPQRFRKDPAHTPFLKVHEGTFEAIKETTLQRTPGGACGGGGRRYVPCPEPGRSPRFGGGRRPGRGAHNSVLWSVLGCDRGRTRSLWLNCQSLGTGLLRRKSHFPPRRGLEATAGRAGT